MRSFHRYLFSFFALVILVFISSNPAYAKRWNVYPEWTRAAIQAVIDTAKDGDVIYFNAGTYDFSLAPANFSFQNGGALQIIDKSLTIKGTPGAIIVGAPVEFEFDPNDLSITWMKGINCFWILNSDYKKDVSFDGLTFQTFMCGVAAFNLNGEPYDAIYYANLSNLVVKNCTFIDMKRNGIAVAGAQGDITIANNSINGDKASSRFGMFFDWLLQPGGMEWQPKNTLVTVRDNSISNFYWGILAQRPSTMLIKSNTISNSDYGIHFNEGLKNTATVANNTLSHLSYGIEVSGQTYSNNGVPFEVVARGITLKYNNLYNISGIGINIWGDLAYSNSIVYNTITMASGSAIYSEGNNNEYKNNIIQGYGDVAVNLGGGLSWAAHNEYVKANSVLGFTPIYWHYFLNRYTHDNTVIGIQTENATCFNRGTNNILKFVYQDASSASTTTLMSLDSPKPQNRPKKGAELL